ncbi:MAG: transketolase C-terminal domain-containing protein [bacterium]|nr:transketolase C-terminal domain-containing protein [bacterium]
MRNTFVKQLIERARSDKDLYLLTADLGYKAFENFRDEFPDRFINAGVAEANMIGVAAGLALTGKKVCVYSIIPFLTLRCLEQIRNNICHHNLNVNIVGIGGGFNYGNQGCSHHTIEDVAVMRALPNMTVLCPGDRVEADLAVRAMFDHDGPTYIRLGIAGKKTVYDKKPEFVLGRGLLVRDGIDLTLISTGNIIDTVLDVADILEQNGLRPRIISMPCLKPIDKRIILRSALETGKIYTIEENSEIGGLGSTVSDLLVQTSVGVKFKKFALADKCHIDIGSHQYLKEKKGLGAEYIAGEILKRLN